MPWAPVFIAVDHRTRSLCTKPYPGHPKGCPNFGKAERCPPKVQLIERLIDTDDGAWAIWNVFDLAEHARQMRELHPKWTERQIYNVLYWQPKARKQLRSEIAMFLMSAEGRGLRIIETPEACGIDVHTTMHGLGIELEWPARNLAYQIAIAGKRIDL